MRIISVLMEWQLCIFSRTIMSRLSLVSVSGLLGDFRRFKLALMVTLCSAATSGLVLNCSDT